MGRPFRMTMLHEPAGTNAQKEPPKPPLMSVFQTEELVNTVTHGIGLVLSIVGAIVLIARSHCQVEASVNSGQEDHHVSPLPLKAAVSRPLHNINQRLDHPLLHLCLELPSQ